MKIQEMFVGDEQIVLKLRKEKIFYTNIEHKQFNSLTLCTTQTNKLSLPFAGEL